MVLDTRFHIDSLWQFFRKCDSCFITKYDRSLLQNASGFYYKMRQLLENATFTTNCDNTYRWQKSAVNRNLAGVINNWNNYLKCFYELINSCIFLHDQISYKFKIKLTANCFNFIGNESLSSVIFGCFCIFFHDLRAFTVIEYFPYLFVL